jgi:proline iminopeptidase
MSRLLRLVARAGMMALVVLVAFGALAAFRYYSPVGAERSCQGCAGEATAVKVGGFDLYYREIGSDHDGTPVVVLHGGPGHSSESFHRGLDFLADGYRVVYYDQRGSGYSQIRPEPSLYTIELLVDELEAIRSDVLRADRMILVAHSAGGALAQRYALAYPEHVEKLVLISSIPINNGVSTPWLWDAAGPALSALGLGFPPTDPAAANAWFTEKLIETSAPRLYDPSNRSLLQDSGTVSFVTWREVSRSLEGRDYSEELADLHIPTLVTYGVADGAATGEAVASRICETLPDCQVVGFQRSGHWPFLEEPEEFARVLSAFLATP